MTCSLTTTPEQFTIPLGAPISYTLRYDQGSADPSVYTVTTKLKPIAITETRPPDQSVESAGDFTVTFVPLTGQVAAHWIVSLSGAQCAAIGEGRFIAEDKFAIAGFTQFMTDPVIIIIRPSVSG